MPASQQKMPSRRFDSITEARQANREWLARRCLAESSPEIPFPRDPYRSLPEGEHEFQYAMSNVRVLHVFVSSKGLATPERLNALERILAESDDDCNVTYRNECVWYSKYGPTNMKRAAKLLELVASDPEVYGKDVSEKAGLILLRHKFYAAIQNIIPEEIRPLRDLFGWGQAMGYNPPEPKRGMVDRIAKKVVGRFSRSKLLWDAYRAQKKLEKSLKDAINGVEKPERRTDSEYRDLAMKIYTQEQTD